MEAGGLGGDDCDEGGERDVPHYHSATFCLDFVQGEVLLMIVLRVKMSIVLAKEGSEKEVEITLVEHGLTEEDQ